MNFLPENPNFADILDEDIICNSQPMSIPCSQNSDNGVASQETHLSNISGISRPQKYTGQNGEFRSIEEIDPKYRTVFTYPYFNAVQSRVIEDALYSDKSMVVCAPTGSGKTVVFEMAIVQLLMDMEDKNYKEDFKIIYMAPVKSLCTERLTEWYPKLTKLGLLCIEVTGDTDVEFPQLKPYKVIITTPEKWDMLTRRWRDHRGLVEVIKLFLIDEVHILNDNLRGPVLEAVVSRMKTIESSVQTTHRIEQLQKQYNGNNKGDMSITPGPRIRFVAVSATVNNPEDVAAWLGSADKPAVYYKFGDECRPVKIMRVVEGYPCPQGMSIFKFDIILNYKLWPIIQKYHNGKPTLIFCNTRKSVTLTAEALSREITINFNPEQKAKLTALASTIKNKKLQALILNGVGCHHAGLLFEERMNIEHAFRNRDLPILITTTTLAMGVNLPAHLVIIKNTQQYVNGAYQEYSISTILQMVGRAGRPQFDTEATAVIMTRMADKARYHSLVEGTEPLESFLHKRLAENLNSEAALGTVTDVAQCVQWVNSTFLSVRAAKDPRRYLGLPNTAPANEISKKIEELCVKAMNRLASSGLITMDEVSCIESTEAGKLMSIYYLDLETMKLIMKIEGSESLDQLLWLICESHELSDMHLRVDERRCLNTLNRSNATATIRFPMKGKISSRQMKLNCIIQAVLGCLPIADPSLNQEAMKIMRIALRVCKCLVAYTTRQTSVFQQPKTYLAVLNSIVLLKCLSANLWENSRYVSKQLKGIGPAFSMLLASAGKTNFLLLEESHPRDLERIMNKGPPAGNIIRKQISLLPKYQLTITLIDRDKIQIKLMLINQAYLSENLENCTAGVNHRSYIIVGDSENNLLYLTSFKDSDLINIYDGCITCDITRKHNHEHKITALCVSSSFVGIDVQSEYLFIGIGPNYSKKANTTIDICENDSKLANTTEQSAVDRKRKSNTNIDVACSKEKMKRNNTLIENFKCLKETFGKSSKEIMGNLPKSTEMTQDLMQDLTHSKCTSNEYFQPDIEKDIGSKDGFVTLTHDDCLLGEEFKDLEDEDHINNILSEIENEMIKTIDKPLRDQELQNPVSFSDRNKRSIPVYNNKGIRRPYKKPVKCNFNAVDILNRKNNDDENEIIIIDDDTEGFTNTVKSKIDQYLQNAQSNKGTYKDINYILEIEDTEVINMKNAKKSSNKIVDDIVTDCSQVQNDCFIIQSERNSVDHRPNIEEGTYKDSKDNNILEVKEMEVINSENDRKSSNEIVDDIVNDCSQVKNDNCIIQSERNSVIDSPNVDDEFDKELKEDSETYVENYEKNRTTYNSMQIPSSVSDINSNRQPLSMVVNDKRCATNKTHNDNDLILSTDIPPENKNTNVNEKYVLPMLTNLELTSSEGHNLSDINFRHSINDLSCANSPCSETETSQKLHNNTPPPPHLVSTCEPKIDTFGIEDKESGQNLDCKDTVHNKKSFIVEQSSLLPVLDSKTFNKRQFNDTHIPPLHSLRENELDVPHCSLARNSSFNSTNLCFSSNASNTDHSVNNDETGSARIEKYCFRSTQFNVCSENNNIHTIKIISKLKIDLDITKIVSTKKDRTNTKEVFNNPGKSNTSCCDSELNSLDTAFTNPSTVEQVNNVKEYSNNMLIEDSNVEKSKSSPDIKEPSPNKLDTKIGNEGVNKVGNILKKYGNILSSRKSKLIDATAAVTKQINNSISEKPIEKPKRRYKISDIVNSNVPLPKKYIDEFRLVKSNYQVIEGDQNELHKDDYSTDDIRSSNNLNNISKPNLLVTAPIHTFSNETVDCEINIDMHSPNSKILDASQNFDLNSSMLNPKTLLECYNSNNNIEDIVAPPPEFADDTTLSTPNNAASGYSPFSPVYNSEIFRYNILNENSDSETKDVSCILNELSHADEELLSCEEIDELTLSPENSLQDTRQPLIIQNPTNSYCIVSQNNVSTASTFFSNKRNAKLGEFKYKRKNMLKLRKY